MEKLGEKGAHSQFCYTERHIRSSSHCVSMVYAQYPHKNFVLYMVQKDLSIGPEKLYVDTLV